MPSIVPVPTRRRSIAADEREAGERAAQSGAHLRPRHRNRHGVWRVAARGLAVAAGTRDGR